jgi:serine/threonine protein kinase
MDRANQLERRDLEGSPRRLLQRGRASKPDVWLVDSEHGTLVWKDFAARGVLVRKLWGPWSTRREVRAYRLLVGHPSVPRLIAAVDPLSFAVMYRPGRPLSRRVRRHLRPEFFDDLAAGVEAMHDQGVVHLDLRHRSNILVDAEGRPILIDFGSALCLRPRSLFWRLLAAFDRRAVKKWRTRHVALQVGSGTRRGAS